MRPLSLEIEGLRSFRTRQVIDFTGHDYIAVIGDTGAGKSSILEALTFALFGRTTFSGQGHQELMNSSSTVLRVAFAFDVGGERWEAARTLRRSAKGVVGTGPVSLEHIAADGSVIEKLDKAREMTLRVESVLGLDAEAFLRTVVLPQGQFSRLLVDDDQRQRSSVLRQIWRTDELTRAGAAADAALRELGPLQGRVSQALAGEPEHPHAHLSELEQRAARRAAAYAEIAGRQRQAAEAASALVGAAEEMERCDAVVIELSKWDGASAKATATDLATAAVRFDAQVEEMTRALDGLASQVAAVPDDSDGYRATDISTFTVLLQQLPALAEQCVVASRDSVLAQAALIELADQEIAAAATAEEARKRAAALQAGRPELAASVEAASARRSSARAALDTARRAHAGAATAEAALDAAELDVGILGAAYSDARAAMADAERAHEAAATALATTRRISAAADASHGLHPGDACPLCERKLVEGWHPPVAPDLEAARASAEEAGSRLDSARRSVANCDARARAAAESAAGARVARAKAQAEVSSSLETLERYLGEPPDLQRSDSMMLETLDRTVEQTTAALRDYDAVIEATREALTTVSKEHARAEAAHRAKVAELVGLERRRNEALQALADHVAGLPADLRPAGLSPGLAQGDGAHALGPEGLSPGLAPRNGARAVRPEGLSPGREQGDGARAVRPEGLSPGLAPGDLSGPPQLFGDDLVGDVARTLAALDERRRVLEVREAERNRWGDEINELRSRRHASERARAVEVEQPAGRLWSALVGRTHVLERAAADLQQRVALSTSDEPPAVGDLIPLVDQVNAATAQLVAAAQAATTVARSAADSAVAVLAQLAVDLQLAGQEHDRTVSAIARAADDASFEARTAQAALDDFRSRLPFVAALKTVADELDAHMLALADLVAALRDGAFPKWLTLRRSRSLLVHASRLLSEITGGRYAFADLDDADSQWFVFDRDHGQPRSPASLSGGEKFVASLALALGMVEMMGRQGDRIGSLFLDEGFGALDRTNLDAAVEALASVAATGRMVAVITHLRAVAEQIDDVLSVTCEATGTKVAWLDASARSMLSDRELSVRGGLLE